MFRISGGAIEATWADSQRHPGVLSAQSWRYVLKAAIATLRLWSLRHRTRRQLALLDDHQLRDIGLSRVDAQLESSLPFWRT